MSDFRLALRQLRKRPLLSLTCIGVLAFGLGANTAVFSVLYAVMWKPLPYPDPDRVVALHNRFPGLHLPRLGASPPDYFELRGHTEWFADAGAYYFLDLTRTGVEHPQKVNAIASTSSLFGTLGVAPMMGRTFTAEEERYQGPHAVLLSEAYWRSDFGADPKVLGQTMQLDGEPYSIVGIMPPSFHFPNDVTQMWAPATFTPASLQAPRTRQNYYLRMLARIAPQLSLEQASAGIERLSLDISLQHPEDFPAERQGWRFFLLPMGRDDDGSVRRWMALLFAAVGCLLLIVCSNVAGLILTRSAERQFDLSLRMALGAGRLRIVRLVLTEVMLLAATGGAAALVLAQTGVGFLAKYGPSQTARIETPVFWFGIGLTLLTGVACGLYPAWAATRSSMGDALKQGSHQGTASPGKRRWQKGLIVAQVGIATALLVSGGLLVRSLLRLLDTPLGFDPRHVLTMEITLPRLRYKTPESRVNFFQSALEQAARIPGVDAASGCTLLPFGYGENGNTFAIVGKPRPPVAPYANFSSALPNYFETMRIALLRGRFFTAQDRAGTVPVAIVDETLARRFLPGEDPLGKQLELPSGKYVIAGVVGNVKNSAVDEEIRPTIYLAAAQRGITDLTVVIRSELPQESVVRSVERIVRNLDRDEPVYEVMPLERFIGRTLKTRRFVVSLMTAFAGAGTLLAAVGLYGLLSVLAMTRRREVGIRMALGADRRAIVLLIGRQGIGLVALGLALGCAGAAAAYRAIASQLYGTNLQDGFTWMAALGIVATAGIMACAIPAWRAARLDPVEALRAE